MEKEIEITFPDVNYGENNKERYNELINFEWSPFFGCSIWEVFIFCMSYAYAKKLSPNAPTGKGTLNAKVFSLHTRYLMRALAIEHYKDISVIKDTNRVVRICEEFANAGIEVVHHRVKNKPTEKPRDSIFLEMRSEINQN